MVDYCQRHGFALSCILLLTLFFCLTEPRTATQKSSTTAASNVTATLNSTEEIEEIPVEMHRAYRGSWHADAPGLFARLKKTQGRGYFECHTKISLGCRLFLFDGEWEDDTLYALEVQNVTFDHEKREVKFLSHPAFIYSISEQNFMNCQVDGNVTYSQGEEKYETQVLFLSEEKGFRLEAKMKELTESDQKDPKAIYSVLFSVLSVAAIFAFAKHAQACNNSEQVAAKTSLGFLLMNAVIDAFLCLWHLNLAFQFLITFDYMILASFWSFAVFMVVQARLTPLVWKAQNVEVASLVRTKKGYIRIRNAFNTFQSRFLVSILFIVLTLVVFSSAYQYTIPLMHLFFLPQIVSNAVYGWKNALKLNVYLPLGLARMFFLVSFMQLYLFGCPANFLVWGPKYWICGSSTLLLIGQMLILHIQNSRRGPRFFVPDAYRPQVYSYYRSLEEEAQIEESSECIICMTLLNLPNAKKEEVTNLSKTMHTPCGHRYHADCLQNWMVVKLECPTCRSALPQLEEEQ